MFVRVCGTKVFSSVEVVHRLDAFLEPPLGSNVERALEFP